MGAGNVLQIWGHCILLVGYRHELHHLCSSSGPQQTVCSPGRERFGHCAALLTLYVLADLHAAC